MKLKEFNGILIKSAQFNIKNHSENISIDDFIMRNEFVPKRSYLGKIAYSLTSLVIIFLLTFFIYVRMTPVTTLTIDINPSFEVELNAFDRVVSITGLDDEATTFLDSIKAKNKKVDDLVELFYEKGIEDGYFSENEAFMLVGVFSSDYQSELEIGDLLTNFTKVTFLTVFLHLETDQLYLTAESSSTTNPTASESIDSDYGSSGLDNMDAIDMPEGILDDSENPDVTSNVPISVYASEFDVSQARLAITIEIFNSNSEYDTLEEFEALLDLSIEDLMNEYNDIE
ncbi:hypothetical protein RJI07_00535 [Mycoplasmatota bacterium WC30]